MAQKKYKKNIQKLDKTGKISQGFFLRMKFHLLNPSKLTVRANQLF